MEVLFLHVGTLKNSMYSSNWILPVENSFFILVLFEAGSSVRSILKLAWIQSVCTFTEPRKIDAL